MVNETLRVVDYGIHGVVSSDIQPMASTCIVYCKIIVSESHCVIWMVVNGKFGMTLKEVGLFFRYLQHLPNDVE
jgi:hypothetical protein